VARRLIAERVDVHRQIEIVVDRLGHVDDAETAAGVFLEPHRGKRGIVAADGDELRHVEAQQRVHGLIQQPHVRGRIGAGDAEVRAAAEVDPADRVDGQGGGVIDVALHEPLEAVAHADDVDAFEPGADGGRGDDTVDAGGGAAADEDRETLVMFRHGDDEIDFRNVDASTVGQRAGASYI
jgi:hypothetical protein